MPAWFQELEEHFAITPEDEDLLAETRSAVSGSLAEIGDEIVAFLAESTGVGGLSADLRPTLDGWLAGIFAAPCDPLQYQRIWRLGRISVCIGLVKPYVLAAQDRLRRRLDGLLAGAFEDDASRLARTRLALSTVLFRDMALLDLAYARAVRERDEFLRELLLDLNKVADFDSALRLALEHGSRFLAWEYAEAWVPGDGGQVLELHAVWDESNGGFSDLRRKPVRGLRLRRGEGLPGSAWAAAKMVWTRDLAGGLGHLASKRQSEARPRTGAAVPVHVRDDLAVVLVYYTSRAQEEDEKRIEALSAAATSLGSLLEHKRVEEALRESDRRLRQIAENLPGALWLMTPDLETTVYVSRGYEDLWHTSCSSLYDNPRSFLDSVHEEDRDTVRQRFESAGSGGEVEYRLGRHGRETVWIRSVVFPIRNEEGEVYRTAAISENITMRKTMARKLEEQAGLVRLGELASAIAHEIKSPLASLITGLEFLGRRLPDGGPEARVAEELAQRVRSLHDTSEELLSFGKPRRPELRPTTVGAIVEKALAIVRADPRCAAMKIETEIEDAELHCDEAQLVRVLVNLLANAAEAMGGGGECSLRGAAPGDRVRFTVRDRGPGIPPELTAKIHQPFFTTKDSGTGLGLPIVGRIVESHGGRLEIAPATGGGVEASIDLPRSEKKKTGPP